MACINHLLASDSGVVDSSQVHLGTALQSCGKMKRRGYFGRSSLEFSTGSFRIESVSSCFRLEKAIASLKPAGTKTDPTTNLWTVYKQVADEHDNDLVSKYVGDLDTSLLFVSAFASPARLIRLNQVPSRVRRAYSPQLLPRSLPKLYQSSSQARQI